jgi:hypothetical protein
VQQEILLVAGFRRLKRLRRHAIGLRNHQTSDHFLDRPSLPDEIVGNILLVISAKVGVRSVPPARNTGVVPR